MSDQESDGRPVPYRFERTHDAAAVVEAWAHLAPGEESGVTVGVAGRIMLARPQGKLGFFELRDTTGSIKLFALASLTEHFDELVKFAKLVRTAVQAAGVFPAAAFGPRYGQPR